jgi:hypothetical protein
VIVSSNAEECCAKALEFEERARTARLPDLKRLYEGLARQRLDGGDVAVVDY